MQEFLRSCRYFFGYAFFFSMFVNILQLTFSIYMLQVYDKVLTSYNLSTLAVITLAAVICLVVLALLEWIRSRLLVRAGIAFDNMLSATVLSMNLKHAAAVPGGAGSRGNLRDVQQLRNFLGGNAVFAFFDLPWMPIYFALIFVLHPALGWVAVGGGVIVFILGVLTERLTRTRLENATRLNAMAAGFTGAALRNASIVRAMGMVGHVTARWRRLNDAVIGLLARAVLNLKQRNATVVLVTHKPSILNIVDNIIVMQEGQIALSGPRQAVLEKLAAMRHQQEQAAQARMQQEKIARQQQALQKQQEALQKTQEAGGNA